MAFGDHGHQGLARTWRKCVWRKRYGQIEAADVRQLRTLEQENARLKKLLAERDLAIEVMQDLSAQYPRFGYRRSCWAFRFARSKTGSGGGAVNQLALPELCFAQPWVTRRPRLHWEMDAQPRVREDLRQRRCCRR
jgi:hypothetical protein